MGISNQKKIVFKWSHPDNMKPFLWICVFCIFSLFSCTPNNCSDHPECTSILFIGNSYTFVNDLPGTFTKLAQSGGHRVETGMSAQGGWMLSNHQNSPDTISEIKKTKWNYIVLQEQSEIPASEQMRNSQMFPAARKLIEDINQAEAKPVLFVTWAHRNGWPENGIPNYEGMQLAINFGYLTLGQQQNTIIAPVGYAWLAIQRNNPQLKLWQEDGSHPNPAGTYLAACVFYSVFFQQSPEGLAFHSDLSDDEAALIQKTAGDIVLNNKKKWNLP